MQARSWEPSLLSLAYEAVHSVVPPRDEVQYEQKLWNAPMHMSASITSVHSRSFYLATALLPAEKRRSARALYAFCRRVDDLV